MFFLLSVSCPVAGILSHCGATVTKTNSSYVQTNLAIKLILIIKNYFYIEPTLYQVSAHSVINKTVSQADRQV